MTDSTSSKAFGNAARAESPESEALRRTKRMVKEKKFFDQKAEDFRAQVYSQHTQETLDLGRRHADQKAKLEEKLDKAYGASQEQNRMHLKALQEKAEKSRLSEEERRRVKALQANLADGENRQKEQRDALAKRQDKDKKALSDRHASESRGTEQSIDAARQERQRNGWKPAPVVFQPPTEQGGEMSFQKPAHEASSSQGSAVSPKTVASSPKPTLAPKGARTGNLKPAREAGASKGAGKGKDFGL